MRKKDLFNQNVSLFNQLEQCKLEIKKLNNELSKTKQELLLARSELKNINSKNIVEDKGFVVNTNIDEVVAENPTIEKNDDVAEENLSDEFVYGSKAIGKIVLESAKCSDKLLKADEDTRKSLSNLIVCKTEFVKSEILSICSSETSLSTKFEMIDAQVSDAVDYFKSVIAQIV